MNKFFLFMLYSFALLIRPAVTGTIMLIAEKAVRVWTPSFRKTMEGVKNWPSGFV